MKVPGWISRLLFGTAPNPNAQPVAPHVRWPEILDWREGDRFENMFAYGHSFFTLIAVQADGYAVVAFFENHTWIPIKDLVGHNASLRTRQVDNDLNGSSEYMELLNQFHIAVDELKARDKRNNIG